jgi:hypothetical protein
MSDRLVARRHIFIRPSTVAKRRAAEADHLPAPDAALGNAALRCGNGWRPTCLDRSTATAATPTKASARPSLLGELRLPPWPSCGRHSPNVPIVRAGRRRACWQPLANSNSPSEPQRRVQRHLLDARLPSGKTLDQNPPPPSHAPAGARSAAVRGSALGLPAQF